MGFLGCFREVSVRFLGCFCDVFGGVLWGFWEVSVRVLAGFFAVLKVTKRLQKHFWVLSFYVYY